ncbi:MAG: GNAT family N-acetyltransferase [Hyphomicrobiales bacterium]|uniref:GNAT family N-acetyltransferase n=1 Tax=Rhabdaerophilum calidifontis TaxID=2604328 RepID=UPI001239C4CF|nr:GNAT family N-acetyltransferase [Rhabdaerophilum calidifontis]MCA1951401.1 GNAT family N-acetyltransferase [Hyphomicrobiales bacterium]
MTAPDSTEPLCIAPGPPPHFHEAAARLYVAAFLPMVTPIYGSEARAIAFLAEGLCDDRAFIATRGGRLLGIAGFKLEGRGVFHRPLGDFLASYGWTSPFRLALAMLLDRPETPGELLMDGIAVAPEARGQGIGTRLLAAICDHARMLGREAVRLDVIDTNPEARRLYLREGFVPGETIDLGPLRWILPFRQVTTMRKRV